MSTPWLLWDGPPTATDDVPDSHDDTPDWSPFMPTPESPDFRASPEYRADVARAQRAPHDALRAEIAARRQATAPRPWVVLAEFPLGQGDALHALAASVAQAGHEVTIASAPGNWCLLQLRVRHPFDLAAYSQRDGADDGPEQARRQAVAEMETA